MTAEVRNIVALHQVKGDGVAALCEALEGWLSACLDAAGLYGYRRGVDSTKRQYGWHV